MVTELILFSREGCHLCEDMLFALQNLSDQHSFSVQVVDIDEGDRLRKALNAAIPLLLLNGKVVSQYHLNYDQLQKALST